MKPTHNDDSTDALIMAAHLIKASQDNECNDAETAAHAKKELQTLADEWLAKHPTEKK